MGKEQFSSNVVVANEYTLLGGSKTIMGTKTINANTSYLCSVGASGLSGRTTLFIQNHIDNDVLYIGLSGVSANNFGLVLNTGQGVQLKLSSTDPINLYMISPSAGKVGIIEGAI